MRQNPPVPWMCPRFETKMISPPSGDHVGDRRSEEHTSELQSQSNLVCRLLLEKKKCPEPSDRPRPAVRFLPAQRHDETQLEPTVPGHDHGRPAPVPVELVRTRILILPVLSGLT